MKKVVYAFILTLMGAAVQLHAQPANIVTIDAANQKAILKYVNQDRIQHGLKPLQMNKLMSDEAAKHSRDMAKHRIPFGHQYFGKRIHRLFGQIKLCQSGAENVAYAYKDGKAVVMNWLTSPGHRRNIRGNYNLTGIGLARDEKGKIYYTQIFLRTTNPVYLQK
ncbi:CAP domain-containing protein [Legionella fairfieldensis]|uniref:CAP domain-containing protein n=1 Tax=Legionella fairfieldensis TaxID=45064 RepID=UPI00056A274F|nr:CAP domain-containing protein [Legionella fairfieldensis]